MQLTQFTDYALRILMDLALQPGKIKTIDELAARHRGSSHHLAKVVQKLNKLGYVRSIRGKGGGVELQRDPAKINIGMLVRETESFALVECLKPGNQCRLTPVCRLKGVLQDAMRAFMAELDAYTLADVIDRPEGLLNELFP